MADDQGDIIHRMLRQLEEEDATPNGAPRCDGCSRRVELAPYQRRMQAMIELVEDGEG